MALRFGCGVALFLLLALSACVRAPESGAFGISPTQIAVAPEDFLDGVDCSTNPGAMRSYVVTLSVFDHAADTTPFILPSTLATACSTPAGLQRLVVAGKRYTAEIDGYQQLPSALTPFGGASSGSRQMLDAKGNVVAPRWTTRCGSSAASATIALSNQTSYVTGCEPIVDHGASITALRIDPLKILGSSPCGATLSFNVDVLFGELAPIVAMPCDAPPVDLPVVAGKRYELYAHTKLLGQLRVGTECSAVGEPAEIVTPTCDTWSDMGSAIIDLRGVVKKGQPACAAGLFFDVLSKGSALNAIPLACTTTAQVGPLSPGITSFSILTYDANGKAAPGGASCAADIAPGRLVAAVCL